MKKILIISAMILPSFLFGQVFTKNFDTIPIGKTDTLPVVMLISGNYGVVQLTKGYVVNIRIRYYNEPGSMCIDCENYWQFVTYLTEDKKKFPDNVIVWLSK